MYPQHFANAIVELSQRTNIVTAVVLNVIGNSPKAKIENYEYSR